MLFQPTIPQGTEAGGNLAREGRSSQDVCLPTRDMLPGLRESTRLWDHRERMSPPGV